MSLQAARFLKPAKWRSLAAALVLFLPYAATSQTAANKTADSRIDSLLADLARVRTPTSVSISPDGATIAYAFNGGSGSELHLTPIASAGSSDRVLSPDTIRNATNTIPGICASSHPNWSPDGKQLAFLSGCASSDGNWQSDSQDNIFVWAPAMNEMKQVSHLHGAISDLQWSPDGKSIAFLFVENATRHAGALDAMKPWNGVYGEDGVEVQRVAVVNVWNTFGGWLSADPKLHVYEFSWSPDSKRITYVAAPPPGENTWWVARLYVQTTGTIGPCGIPPIDQNAVTGCAGIGAPNGVPESLFDPKTTVGPLHDLQIAVPRFSPDGKQIAFIGGLMSDQGSTGGDIYVIPTTGLKLSGEPKDVTPNRPSTPAWLAWRDDHSLLISEHTGGSSHITALDLDTGKDIPSVNLTLPETIIAGTDVMSLSTSSTPNVAVIRQSFDRPPEVWAGPLASLKQISHLNDTIKPAWG
ncbi:MAG: hypothetical protein P4M04_11190 [Acidobacteriota bacterium]|nr:hypothetical protein [Acidobacteriota bacterium]